VSDYVSARSASVERYLSSGADFVHASFSQRGEGKKRGARSEKSSKRQEQIKTTAKRRVAVCRMFRLHFHPKEISVSIQTIDCHLPDRNPGDPHIRPASRAEALASLATSSILKSLFVSIVGPLHKSRRRQARRIIRQQRDLVAGARREVPDIAKWRA
jgi:hypothetical protein